MKQTYYLFNAGRLSRRDNSLKYEYREKESEEKKTRYIPVENIEDFYAFGEMDANSSLFNFLGRNKTAVHFFDYYENYTGSFMPRDYLLSGRSLVEQTRNYLDLSLRIPIAAALLEGAAFNILKNLKYYDSRGKDLKTYIESIEDLRNNISSASDISSMMGVEGNIRQVYYAAMDIIVDDFTMEGRQKRPPGNELNSLISFGNMLCYTQCLKAIYHTQLNPTISFLHEPGERRFSLALDLAEIFKPLLVDRLIFRVLNRKEIQRKDFITDMNGVALKDGPRKEFVKKFEERLAKTIQHRVLKKKVSYKYLIRLECYKLIKHCMGMDIYKPFQAWW